MERDRIADVCELDTFQTKTVYSVGSPLKIVVEMKTNKMLIETVDGSNTQTTITSTAQSNGRNLQMFEMQFAADLVDALDKYGNATNYDVLNRLQRTKSIRLLSFSFISTSSEVYQICFAAFYLFMEFIRPEDHMIILVCVLHNKL